MADFAIYLLWTIAYALMVVGNILDMREGGYSCTCLSYLEHSI